MIGSLLKSIESFAYTEREFLDVWVLNESEFRTSL